MARRAVGVVGLVAVLVGAVFVVPAGAADYLSRGSEWRRYTNIAPDGESFEVFPTPNGYGAILLVNDTRRLFTSGNGTKWKSVPTPTVFTGEMGISASATGNGRIVVAGSIGTDETSQPTFWVSKDGKRWTRNVGSLAAFGDPRGTIFVNDVAYGGGQWVAVGGDSTGDTLVPAIWTSKDVKTWRRVPSTGDLQTTNTTFLRDVASSGSRFVAVGAERDTVPGAVTYGETPIAYTSTDGKAWTRASSVPVPQEAEVTRAANPDVVRRVVSDGVLYANGRFVIWGDGTNALAEGSIAATPFVVTSKNGDGGSGVALPGPTGDELWTVTDIAARGSTLVAVGYHTKPGTQAAAAVWVSKDLGRKWKLLTGPQFALPPRHKLGGPTHVEVAKKGVLATGVTAGPNAGNRPAAWVGGTP